MKTEFLHWHYKLNLNMHVCYDRHMIILMTRCTPDYNIDWSSYYLFIFGMLFRPYHIYISFIICSHVTCTYLPFYFTTHWVAYWRPSVCYAQIQIRDITRPGVLWACCRFPVDHHQFISWELFLYFWFYSCYVYNKWSFKTFCTCFWMLE